MNCNFQNSLAASALGLLKAKQLAGNVLYMNRSFKCQLYKGDCLEIMPKIKPGSVQSVINDLPFGVTDCEWDKKIDLDRWWHEIERVTTETAIVASFATQPFATELINSRRKFFRYELVWDKVGPVGFLNANRQPMRQHELILIFSRRPSGSIYNPQKVPGKPYASKARGGSGVYSHHRSRQTVNSGWRHPISILRHSKPNNRDRLHPTEKPLSLCEWLVLTFTRPGGLILDPTMGSGPVGEAALKHDRRFIGIEQNAEYFQLAAQRLKRYTNRADWLGIEATK